MCTATHPMTDTVGLCRVDYSPDSEDTHMYGEIWSTYTNISSNEDTIGLHVHGNYWRYQTSDQLNGMSIFGRKTRYMGGGYVAELGMLNSQIK